MQGIFRQTAVAIFIMTSFALGGCSLFEKPVNTRPPTPLKPIATSLHVRQIWETTLGNGNNGYQLQLHPFVDGDTVYAVDQAGKIYALNASNGARLWQTKIGQRVTAGVSGGEEKLFIGTQKGQVVAVSIKTHDVIWNTQASSEIMAISRPAQGEVVVHTNAGRIIALDASTGNVIWTQSSESPKLIIRSKTEPVISGNTVVAGFSTGKIAAFSLSDGTPLWQLSVAEPTGASQLQRMVDVGGRIAVVDGVVFAASYHGQAIAATLGKGLLLWSHPVSSYMGLTVGTKAVYITGSKGNIWALDLATGASLWKQPALLFRNPTAPVLNGGYLVLGDYQGYLHWLSLQTGAFVARSHVTDAAIDAAPVVYDNDLYVQAADGTLAMYRLGKNG